MATNALTPQKTQELIDAWNTLTPAEKGMAIDAVDSWSLDLAVLNAKAGRMVTTQLGFDKISEHVVLIVKSKSDFEVTNADDSDVSQELKTAAPAAIGLPCPPRCG